MYYYICHIIKHIGDFLDIERYFSTLSIDEVREVLDKKVSFKQRIEERSLNDALNFVIAEDIISKIDVPQFIKSRMDGYAVIAEDTFDAEEDKPVKLNVIGEIKAGHSFNGELKSGEAVLIATGAPIPEGANAIVMVEFTERNENDVLIYKSVTPGKHLIKIGTDIKKNSKIISKGKLLNIRDLGVLAAINVQKIKIFSPPEVGILSTGDELIQPGEEFKFGKIYDINSVTLSHGVKEAGGNPTFLGILKDNFEIMKDSLLENIEKFDILIISGGTSKGIGDYMPAIIKEIKHLDFFIHGIRIKPGKPTILAGLKRKNEYKVCAILPGYPTSALSIFYQFILPLIYKFRGVSSKDFLSIKGKLRKRIYSEFGRREFKMVRVFYDKDVEIEPIHTGSESITTLAKTDGYIIIPEDTQVLEEGEEVIIHLFP